jgi:hypothetical protein
MKRAQALVRKAHRQGQPVTLWGVTGPARHQANLYLRDVLRGLGYAPTLTELPPVGSGRRCTTTGVVPMSRSSASGWISPPRPASSIRC